MNDEIIKNIEDLYTSSIYPNCEKKNLCSHEKLEEFSKKPKMPYVGREYGNNINIPNLLFLSLDSGLEHPELHTIQEIRKEVETEHPRTIGRGTSNHWYQTFDIAELILKHFFVDFQMMKEKDVFYTDRFIAHTNSSKCTQNKEGRAQADNNLFYNCREFVRKEIPLFNANIIITQGAKAEQVLDSFEVIEKKVFDSIHNGKPVTLPTFIRIINKKQVLHIPMYHQSYYKGYWGQKKVLMENIEQIKMILNQIM